MQKRSILAALMLATVSAATISTAAFAERGPGMAGGMGGGAGIIQNFGEIDADKDGKITDAEMTAYRQAQAAAVDANSDGKLSAEELSAMHLKNMQDRAKLMADKMIANLDTDADGLLTAAEMTAAPMAGKMMEAVDADGDGAVTLAELEAAKEKMGNRRGKHGRHGGGHGFFGGDDSADDAQN